MFVQIYTCLSQSFLRNEFLEAKYANMTNESLQNFAAIHELLQSIERDQRGQRNVSYRSIHNLRRRLIKRLIDGVQDCVDFSSTLFPLASG